MVLYPNLFCKDVTEITIEILRKNNIKGLILDVDNTLIDYHRNLDQKINKWVDNLKKENIKFCIVSNSNNHEKVKKVSEELDIPYFYFAKKPFKRGFLKAKNKMNLNDKIVVEEVVEDLNEVNIAVVGDQVLTDVLGANRCNMFSILVEPINEKDIFITKVKRPIERCIMNRYFKKMQKEKE